MRDPEMFKYDVRVRERMMRAGRLSTDEVDKMLSALPDVEANAVQLDLEQPAVGHADGAKTGASAAEEPGQGSVP